MILSNLLQLLVFCLINVSQIRTHKHSNHKVTTLAVIFRNGHNLTKLTLRCISEPIFMILLWKHVNLENATDQFQIPDVSNVFKVSEQHTSMASRCRKCDLECYLEY